MIPAPDEVSAFAVYSGVVGTSKSKKRRNRHKKMQESEKDQIGKKSIAKHKEKVMANNLKRNSDSANSSTGEKSATVKDKKISTLNKNNKKAASKKSKIQGNKSNGNVSRGEVRKKIMIKGSDKTSKVKPVKRAYDVCEVDLSSEDNASERGIEVINSDSLQNVTNSERVVDLKRKRSDEGINSDNDKSVNNEALSEDESTLSLKKKKTSPPSKMIRQRPDNAQKKKLLMEEVKKQLKGKASTSSVQRGRMVFESLISPFKADYFFSDYWEKKPLFVDRGGDSKVFSQYLSTSEMDSMLRYNVLMFGRNVDITCYSGGVRETHNPEGRAHPHIVWDYYANGCSVRVLNPQTYLTKIHTLLASMQEYFGCFVGSNIYLTPPNTQGFAPHYDDIEAFVLQIEGSKRWRIYKPRSPVEELPRYSSRNFTEEEIGKPVLEVTLKPGDTLYFPRGYIHQAEALPDQHSLHITVSTYQKTSWLDLIEKALPVALARASEESVEFRKGLPVGFLRGAGLAHPTGSLKNEMLAKLKKLIFIMEKHLDVDDAVDKLAISFIHQSLPPVLSQDESTCSVHNGGLRMSEGEVQNRVDLSLNTKVRWVRANAIRIVDDDEEGQVRLYHNVNNSKEYEGEEVQYLLVDKQMFPALMHLVKTYPAYASISQLPCSCDNERMMLTGDLWDRGLLVSESPLEASESPESSDES